jgi:hypothetical protein
MRDRLRRSITGATLDSGPCWGCDITVAGCNHVPDTSPFSNAGPVPFTDAISVAFTHSVSFALPYTVALS